LSQVVPFVEIFWDGGARRVRASVYVPTQPQKKVILVLFQVLDLSSIVITILN